MAEWFKVPVLKTEVSLIGVWVQIPFRPGPWLLLSSVFMGALTSKPYAFRARPWELKSADTFDFLDAFLTPISVHIRGLQILRIIPRPLISNKLSWINDRTRFFFDGLKRQRLGAPSIQINGKWVPVSFHQAFYHLRTHVKIKDYNLFGIAGQYTAFPVLDVFKQLINHFGSEHFYSASTSYDSYKTSLNSKNPFEAIDEATEAVVIVDSNLELEYPTLVPYLRQFAKQKPIFSFGFSNSSFAHNLGTLEEFETAVLALTSLSKLLTEYKQITLVFGASYLEQKADYLNFSKWCKLVFELYKINVALVPLPKSFSTIGGTFYNYKKSTPFKFPKKSLLYLLNADDVYLKINSDSFVIYHGSHADNSAVRANVIFPSETLFEGKDYYSYTLDGELVEFPFVYPAPPKAKSQLFVISSMAKYFGFNLQHTKKAVKRLSAEPIFESVFTKVVVNKSFTAQCINDFYLNDAITKASPVLSLASFRFDKQAEIRNNFNII